MYLVDEKCFFDGKMMRENMLDVGLESFFRNTNFSIA